MSPCETTITPAPGLWASASSQPQSVVCGSVDADPPSSRPEPGCGPADLIGGCRDRPIVTAIRSSWALGRGQPLLAQVTRGLIALPGHTIRKAVGTDGDTGAVGAFWKRLFDGRFDTASPWGQDQSEWQIEWQMALARAHPGLVGAGLCSCSAWSDFVTRNYGTARLSMVRRRSTVRFRKGAPQSSRSDGSSDQSEMACKIT